MGSRAFLSPDLMDGRQGEIPDTNFALTRRLQALRNLRRVKPVEQNSLPRYVEHSVVEPSPTRTTADSQPQL